MISYIGYKKEKTQFGVFRARFAADRSARVRDRAGEKSLFDYGAVSYCGAVGGLRYESAVGAQRSEDAYGDR